jgi:hypothetical protein
MKVVGVLAGAAVLLLLAGLSFWLWAEEPAGTPAPPAALRRDAGTEEFRQWLRGQNTAQKVGLLRVLINSLREDVLEQQRWAAEQWFHKADSDGNGQLSFEEAWQGGLFRPTAGRREGRPGAGPTSGPSGLERREQSRGERRAGPQANVERGEQPPFPISELEQELLESWELLQELNIIGRDAGRK